MNKSTEPDAARHNRAAIEEFERENRTMLDNAPSADWDTRLAGLNGFIEERMFHEYVLPRICHAGPRAEIRVLDIGAGKGRMTEFFLQNGFTCVAVEPSEVFFDRLRQRLANHPLASFHCSDFSRFFKEHSTEQFQIIYVSGVTQYLDDGELDRFLCDARTILSPMGLLVVRDIENLRHATTKDGLALHRAAEDMRKMLDNNGFEIQLCEPLYPVNVAWVIHKRYPGMITRMLWQIASNPVIWRTWWWLRKTTFLNAFRNDPTFVYYVARKRSDNG